MDDDRIYSLPRPPTPTCWCRQCESNGHLTTILQQVRSTGHHSRLSLLQGSWDTFSDAPNSSKQMVPGVLSQKAETCDWLIKAVGRGLSPTRRDLNSLQVRSTLKIQHANYATQKFTEALTFPWNPAGLTRQRGRRIFLHITSFPWANHLTALSFG